MPYAPKSLCVVTGCPEFVTSGRCEMHRLEVRRESDKRRPNASQRGYDYDWKKTRDAYLAAHPQCECPECSALPTWRRPTATDVDHIDARGPRGPRGHDWTNLQSLTASHHARKTAREDGGFGRTKRSTDDWA
jgi:5-methylcytosine-specific restriction protein A